MRVGSRLIPIPGIAQALAIAAAFVVGLLPANTAWAQKGQPPAIGAVKSGEYEVARGDTLFRIAAKTRPQGVTLNQMVLALYRANPDAFQDGNINQLVVGRVLKIPALEALRTVNPADASQQLKALLAKPDLPAPPPPPPPKEPPVPVPPPAPAPKPSARPSVLNPGQAAGRLKEGIEYERTGDLRAAMKSYHASAEAGNGEAQKRLGDIYNTGNAVVRRDYETALRWYQKARAQGIEIPKPITNPGGKF